MLQPHIRLTEQVNASCALLPGDPGRIDRIAPYLTEVEPLAYNREYRSIRGLYKGLPVIAISTGIGGASTAIAVEELNKVGVKAMIRIGSCGALQKDVALGELLLAAGAVRDEGASRAYADIRYPAVADFSLLSCCREAALKQGFPHRLGLIRSHESFYIDDAQEKADYWAKQGILGEDMETAALLTVASLRGVAAASILNNVVLYGLDTASGIDSYVSGEDLCAKGERNEILTALEAFLSWAHM